MPQYDFPWPFPPNQDFTRQSIEVPGTKRPGQTAHYRNAVYPHTTLQSPNALRTLHDVFNEGLRRAGNDRHFLGRRPLLSKDPIKYADYYVWQTWGEINARRLALGSAIHYLFQSGKLRSGDLDTVGIWSKNCPNWQVVDLAAQAYRKVGVSLYDTLGEDAVVHIINHAELSIVFASSEHIPFLLKHSTQFPCLQVIVAMDEISPESKRILTAWGQEKGIQFFEIREVEELGKANLAEPIPVTSDTVATICYTSGTTGVPKGVVLTHGNLAIATQSQLYMMDPRDDLLELGFLPLAHIFERVMELCVISCGGTIGYGTGEPLRLLEDLQVLKPNFFPSVPRVLNRIYQSGMTAAAKPGIQGSIFRYAVSVKIQNLRATGERNHLLWDRLVFSGIRKVLGGNLQTVVTGSAPISPAAMDFLKVAIGGDVIEGRYGMTENCGSCTRCWPGDPSSSGTVGAVNPVTELKLVDVPAMGYSAEDKPEPRGEICFRGDHAFPGYYKDEKNTRATIDEEGWVHTGDVGALDAHLRLKIIDRVKNIMKLAQGEYVALENIENVYSTTPLVSQLFVYGNSLQSYLLGVVVADRIQLAALASKIQGKNVSPEDDLTLQQFIQDPKIVATFMNELNKQARSAGLKGFEMIKRIHITLEPFSVENNCLTPTFKIRRKETYELYKAELDALYDLGEPTSSSSKL